MMLLGEDSEIKRIYASIRSFYEAFVKKLIKVFPFKSKTFQLLSILDPENVLSVSVSSIDELCTTFAVSCEDEVKMQFRDFSADSEAMPASTETDAVQYWLRIKSMKSSTGELMYKELANAVLQLLAIPVSNADGERVFSLVRRVQTDFRSSMSTETLSSLVRFHFNNSGKCCEFRRYPDSFLLKAKTCAMERNLSRRGNAQPE